MNKFMDILGEKIMPLANKIGQNLYLTVLRDAFMLSFPLTMFGSLVVVVNNLPWFPDNTKSTMSTLFGNGQNATMSIMTVFVTIGIGYYFSKAKNVEAIFGGVISLSSFLILTSFFSKAFSVTNVVETITKDNNGHIQVIKEGAVQHITTVQEGMNSAITGDISGILDLNRLGAKGMFLGIIVAFLAAELYTRLTLKGYVIKMPDGVPPAVSKSFSALVPAIGTLLVFLIINALMVGVFKANLHDVIYEVIQKPLTGAGTSLIGTVIAVFFVQFLWFFGLHGQIIVNSVFEPLWQTNMLDNAAATKAGKLLAGAPDYPTHIVTKSFMDTFTVGLGGSGSTLVVVILMAFVMKHKQYRDVGRLALAPGIFNVNEPVIFGLPIVMNAAIFIPWLLAPIVSVLVAYAGFATGLVPLTTGAQVPWTVPIGISGFLVTNSVMGALLQIVQFAIIGIIWLPFLKLIDRTEAVD
ncbi:MAG: PTS sugar transporter subunit IIC [Lactobacillales bacterium]|jgi:PTS system cellobiose-specific IIC component|nr:PTS sugar transporter subunit IIC [Lactobacillales bacterium]